MAVDNPAQTLLGERKQGETTDIKLQLAETICTHFKESPIVTGGTRYWKNHAFKAPRTRDKQVAKIMLFINGAYREHTVTCLHPGVFKC